MCLKVLASRFKPVVAEQDITVYKRFYNDLIDNGVLRTPYRDCIVATPFMEVSKFTYWSHFSFAYRANMIEVNRGIHAYTTLAAAKTAMYRNEVIHECYIPKGTEYIEGLGNQIASKFLIIGEKLKLS